MSGYGEIKDALLTLVEQGEVVAVMDDGCVKYVHIEHATEEHKKNKLSVKELRHLFDIGEDE